MKSLFKNCRRKHKTIGIKEFNKMVEYKNTYFKNSKFLLQPEPIVRK